MKIFKIISAVLLISFFGSCEKGFEDMNKDPFNPNTPQLKPMFTSVIQSMQRGWQERTGFSYEFMGYASQQSNFYAGSGYLLENAAKDIWNQYYFALADMRNMEQQFEELESGELKLDNIRAQLNIVKAYTTLKTVDIYGDIPFSEAAMASEGIEYFKPKYDDQKDIYTQMLNLLKTASESLVENPDPDVYMSYGSSDVFFNNNMLMWKKFANTLRLSHALQAVGKEAAYADHIADILNNNLPLIEEGEDVGFWPLEMLGMDLQQRPWSYSGSFVRFGTTMWDEMADGTTENDIFDPRTYVFAQPNGGDLTVVGGDTLLINNWAPYPYENASAELGQPYDLNRYAGFTLNGDWNFSPFNYWLLRDINTIPELVVTAAQVHFMKAEAYTRGVGVGVDMSQAHDNYEQGIRKSIIFWYNIVATSVAQGDIYAWQDPPAAPTADQVDAMLANPKVAWNDAEALRLIYIQNWIDTFTQPTDGWNLWRRTDLLPHQGITSEYYRLTYPISEFEYNMENYNAASDKIGGNYVDKKVWWMP